MRTFSVLEPWPDSCTISGGNGTESEMCTTFLGSLEKLTQRNNRERLRKRKTHKRENMLMREPPRRTQGRSRGQEPRRHGRPFPQGQRQGRTCESKKGNEELLGKVGPSQCARYSWDCTARIKTQSFQSRAKRECSLQLPGRTVRGARHNQSKSCQARVLATTARLCCPVVKRSDAKSGQASVPATVRDCTAHEIVAVRPGLREVCDGKQSRTACERFFSPKCLRRPARPEKNRKEWLRKVDMVGSKLNALEIGP